MKKKRHFRHEAIVSYLFMFLVIGGAIAFLYFLGGGLTGFAVYDQGDQSAFDEGTYSNTEFNNTGIMLKYWDDSERELPDNKGDDSYFDMNGNVLLMHMNEASGVIEDFSGEGNNGTQSGGVTYGASGKLNTALSFDGVDDYIDVPDDDALSFGDGISDNPFSICSWMNMNDATNFVPLSKDTLGAREYTLRFLNDKIYFYLLDDSSSAYMGRYYDTAMTSYEGTWIHVCTTYDGSSSNSGIKIYMDGTQVDNANYNGGGSYVAMENTVSSLEIGAQGNYISSSDGTIDEVAIWNRSLSSSEISEIYQRQKGKYGKGESGTYTSKVFDAGGDASWNNISWGDNKIGEMLDNQQGSLMSGNVLLMHMNEASGVIEDFSGEGNNGTVTGATYSASGKLNTALSFDGDGDCVSLTSSPINPFGNYAVSLWYNSNDVTTFSIPLSYYEDGGAADPAPEIRFTNGEVIARISNEADANFIISYITEINVWHHVLITKNNNDFRLYYDGLQVNSTTLSGTVVTPQYFRIGCRNYGSGDVNSIDGTIDEVAIWNRSLSASEISEIYQRGVLRLNLTTRSCDDSTCSGESWSDISDTSPQDLSLSNNQYFQYKFNLETDNSLYSPELYNVSIDYTLLNTAPILSLVSPQEGATYGYNESLALDFSVSDADNNLDECWYNLDGGENVSITSCANTTFDVSGDGSYILTIYANDTQGEQASDSASFSVQVGAPTIILHSPMDEYLNYQENIYFNYTPTDIDLGSCGLWGNFDGVFKLNQTDNSPTSGVVNTFNLDLDDGSYLWNIECNDSQGNSAFNGNKTFYVDTVNPEITLIEPTGTKSSRTITSTWDVSDDNLDSCWYNVYRGDSIEITNKSVDCSGSTTFDVTIDADFVFNFYVNDSAGNINSANSSFSVDTSTPPSSSSSSSSSGGGGSSSSRGRGRFNPIIVGDIKNIIANPGEIKKLGLNVKNGRLIFLQDCQVAGKGKYANWFTPSETKGLAGGESYEFSFGLDIPEILKPNIYNLSVGVVCGNLNKTVNFNLEIIEKKLLFNLIKVERESKDFVKIIYSIKETSNLEQNVELQFLLFDSNNEEVAEVNESKIISANSKQEFEILIPVDPSLEGELNLLVNLNSATYSTFAQENIVLGSSISGFSVFGNSTNIDNVVTELLILAFLVFTFFMIRRILRHKRILGDRKIKKGK